MTDFLINKLFKKNEQAAEEFSADRRSFLKRGMLFTAAMGFWMPSLAEAGQAPVGREISIMNVHTGEKFTGEYWYGGRYLPDAFRSIKTLMRDHRNNERFPIDPRLMDVLYVLHRRIGNGSPFHVYSGYRSPETNAMLRRNTEGVAKQSLHMQGQAADIDLPGTQLSSLRKMAITLKTGGVGYYPTSDFIHIDTGRVRTW